MPIADVRIVSKYYLKPRNFRHTGKPCIWSKNVPSVTGEVAKRVFNKCNAVIEKLNTSLKRGGKGKQRKQRRNKFSFVTAVLHV